jgi:alcohol dehydrogenase (cytochrome c)
MRPGRRVRVVTVRRRRIAKIGPGVLAAVLTFQPLPAEAQQQGAAPPLERIVVPRSDAAVTVDGRLDEAVWQNAAALTLVRNDGSGPGRDVTEVRLVYDASALYLAWIVSDTDIQGTFTERDSPFWEEEVAELFITPDGLTKYVELQWNPLGAVFDAIITNYLDESGISQRITGEWDWTAPGMTSAVTVEGTVQDSRDRDVQWISEVRLPFSDLSASAPESGDVWRANFYRYSRSSGQEVEELAWSPTLLNVHQPSRFGALVFGSDDSRTGVQIFEGSCARCHGGDGAGGELGPSIVRAGGVASSAPDALRPLIQTGIPESGMPASTLDADELETLVVYVEELVAAEAENPRPDVTALIEPPRRVPFSDIATPRPGDWPTYHGHLSGNRHSPLNQIDNVNVGSLALEWLFPVQTAGFLEVTPVVVDGTMYVTSANQVYALDAETGRQIWRYRRPRTQGVVGDATGGINRGVAVLDDRVFLATDNAHLIALHRRTGGLIWDTEMADYREHYGATSAPLVAKDVVVSGTSGGDEGVRGFVAGYSAETGEELWRFWTVPLPGEPLSETWIGRALEHACASTWLSGSYDPEADLLYWATGNPCPDFNGDERLGDNLYSNSVLALDPDDGSLAWHFQFTPHDVHDWDAQQSLLLIDAPFGGHDRKLLAQANRNGFFYVLDRLDGELLLAEHFADSLTWASDIGPDGRPVLVPGNEPTYEGVKACPAIEGANNWMSSAYSPTTGLFYVMALEKCNIYKKSDEWWTEGESFYGGSYRNVPGQPGIKYLRAIDLDTGETVWETEQDGPATTWGGALSTDGGLVFYGDDSGAFAAVDATDGRPLWSFRANQPWRASPMTYMVDGRQFVAVAGRTDILVFALP